MYLISKAQALLANAKQWVDNIFEEAFNYFQYRGASFFGEKNPNKSFFSEKYFGLFLKKNS